MDQNLVRFSEALTPRGGVLAREFRRIRSTDSIDWQREKAYALDLIADSDALQRCDPASVGRSLLDLGVLGLTLSPAMRLAYLIPYKAKGRSTSNCTVSPSYMGLEQIAYKTGFVDMIQTVLVHEKDEFKVWTDDTGRHVSHVEAVNYDRGTVTHAYCIAWFSSGKKHVEVMTKQEIIACRNAAVKKNFGKMPFTWQGDFKHEMYKKCVTRRGWKHWPRVDNPRVAAMMAAVDRADPLDFSEDKLKTVKEITTIDQDCKDILIELMQEAGVDARGHDSWLQGLAKRLGCNNISALPATQFGAATSLMKEGLEQWKLRSAPPAQQSGSEPAGTTVPEGAS